MSVLKRRTQAVNRRRWVRELADKWAARLMPSAATEESADQPVSFEYAPAPEPEFTFEDLRTIARNYGTGQEPTVDENGDWFVEVVFNGTPTICRARRVVNGVVA